MRIAPICLAAAMLAAPASAQTLSARLVTPLHPLPTLNDVTGPLNAIYPTSLGPVAVPTLTLPNMLSHRMGPLAQISAGTGVGATTITVPPQALPLMLESPQQTQCGFGRTCQILMSAAPLGSAYTLDSFTVVLHAPVPDPAGGCVTVTGIFGHPVTAQAPAGSPEEFTALPLIPFPGPPNPPEGPPAPMPETYMLAGPATAQFVAPGTVRFEVCGEVPAPRTGLLDYSMEQLGSSWGLSVSGRWTVAVQDNGYLGSGHHAWLHHQTLTTTPDGTLIHVADGSMGQLHLSVERIDDPGQEGLYEQDPAQNPPPEAIAYALSFEPEPGLAQKWTLHFEEPGDLPYSTGQINQQEINHPGAIALSYFFREYMAGPNLIEVPVTGNMAESHQPIAMGAPGQPGGLSLELSWELPGE